MLPKKLFLLLISTAFIACTKKTTTTNPPAPIQSAVKYPQPWSTKDISYTSQNPCFPSYGYGGAFKLLYKDTVIFNSGCELYSGYMITDSVIVNQSVMHLFYTKGGSGIGIGLRALSTQNGGYTWKEYACGASNLLKYHQVNTQLSYCITGSVLINGTAFISGIGKSNLSAYRDTVTSGINYINDFGTDFSALDSTTINLNDSVTFVIKFK